MIQNGGNYVKVKCVPPQSSPLRGENVGKFNSTWNPGYINKGRLFLATWNSGMAKIVKKSDEQRSPFPIILIGIKKFQLSGELC